MTTPHMDESLVNGLASKERRRSPRVKVDQIVYMNFQSGNGGIVLDVSSHGLGFQAADRVDGAESLGFWLSPPTIQHIEITGQVVWLDATRKRGGLRLIHLPVEVRSEIRRWQSQHLPLPADAEGPAEVKPIVENMMPVRSESSFTATPAGGERGPSFPARQGAQKASQEVTAIPRVSQAPVEFSGQGADDFISAAWPPPATLPAPLYSSEATLFSQEESRGRRHPVAVSFIVALSLLAAGALYFGNRRWTGEFLIRLGESISGEQWRPFVQTPPAEGASTGENGSTAGPSPDSSASMPRGPEAREAQPMPKGQGSVDEENTNTSSDASDSNVNGSIRAPEMPQQPIGTQSKDVPAEHSGVTSPPDDNGEAELARARAYLHEDNALAARLLWVAVGKGNRQAELELADLYLRGGGGVRKNCQQARVLLTAAQNNHNAEASVRLAHLRDYGCQ
jgi:hypothetical protein